MRHPPDHHTTPRIEALPIPRGFTLAEYCTCIDAMTDSQRLRYVRKRLAAAASTHCTPPGTTLDPLAPCYVTTSPPPFNGATAYAQYRANCSPERRAYVTAGKWWDNTGAIDQKTRRKRQRAGAALARRAGVR